MSVPKMGLLALPLLLLAVLWTFQDEPDLSNASSSQELAKALKTSRRPDSGPNTLPNEWQYHIAAWPDDSIPLEAVKRAREQARRMQSGQSAQRSIWQQAGPLNTGGRITDIALDAADSNRVFVGSAAGGVFRTEDGGLNWQAVFQQEGSLAIGDVAIDPLDNQTIWVGTGESNSSSYGFPGNGLWKSSDGGLSWQTMGLDSSFYLGRIVIDPTNSDRIWVAALGRLFGTGGQRGIYRSENGGISWQCTLFVNDSTSAVDLAIDPQNPNRLYACMWQRLRTLTARVSGGDGSGVWRTDDGGDSWTELGGVLPQHGSVGRPGVAVAASNPQRVYISYADDPGYFAGLFRSDNGGDSFVRTSDAALANLYSSFGWYFGNLRVDPQDEDHVLALGVGWWHSQNAGQNYSRLAQALHVDFHALERHPQSGRWWVGSDGGLYTGMDLVTFDHFENLPLTQFYRVAIDPNDPQKIYGGTQDNGTNRTLTGATDDWERIFGGDGFAVLIHPNDSNVIYVEYQWGNLYISEDGGQGFSPITAGISSSDRVNWSTPIALDPQVPETLYYGTQRLWRSTNRGQTWTAVSGDLTQGYSGTSSFNTITTLAVSPLNSDVIWVGCDDGNLSRTTSGGAFWQDVSGALVERWITSVVPDPALAAGAIVSLGGLRWEDPQPHVYRTWDYGASWSDISANLPNAPVYDLAFDPLDVQRIWAATETGCYVTHDGGQNWSLAAAGLPLGPVLDLAFDSGSRQLLAGTHGRSAWRLYVDDFSETIPQPSISAMGPELKLVWTAIANAVSYRVYYSAQMSLAAEAQEFLGETMDTTFVHESLQDGMGFYRVRSVFP